MKHHIYYHMDADGHASAGILQEYLERTRGKDVQIVFQPINYGMEPFVRNIEVNDNVYMLDFSLQPVDKMVEFVALCERRRCAFTWVDHHKTAIEVEQSRPDLVCIPGIRKEGKAGCELTWEYFNKERPTNRVVELVANWDMWRKDSPDWNTLVVPLQTYLRFIRSDPKYNKELWPSLLSPAANLPVFLKQAEETGGLLTKFQHETEDARMHGFARRGLFAGYKAVIVNSPQMNSGPFERMRDINEIDLMVAWVFSKQGQFAVSIYTAKDIDVGALCKKLAEDGPYKSGGGHPKAAGFQTDWEHLSSLMSF
jgi:oligoribonuclease NrnB/cAMP/cGMP phosphodiesterase (DHH superfamily)